MSSDGANDRKRKPTNIVPETVPSTDYRNPKERKARRVNTTNASASTAASVKMETPVAIETATTVNDVSAATEDEEEIKSIGNMIQDLAHPDNAKVDAALGALDLEFMEDKKKSESFVSAGGCLALVQLLNKYLDKTIARIPACDQVTKLIEVAELTTLDNTLDVIVALTFFHGESRVSSSAIGGVEAVVKVMKTFPKCQMIQEHACCVLRSLACSVIGATKAIESGGIEVLLTAVTNHLGSAFVCRYACGALINIVMDRKENTELLITLGGGAAVAKVRRKWPDNNTIQKQVRRLNNLIVAEMKTWADEA